MVLAVVSESQIWEKIMAVQTNVPLGLRMIRVTLKSLRSMASGCRGKYRMTIESEIAACKKLMLETYGKKR